MFQQSPDAGQNDSLPGKSHRRQIAEINRGRLAFFIHNMGGGGAQRIMLTLAEAVAQRGYAVDLVLVRAEGPHMSDIPDGVRVVDLNARRIISSLPALVRYLRQEQPITLLSFLSPVNCVAIWAKILSSQKVRVVISERSTLTPAKAAARTDRLVLPWLMRWSYPYADALIAISNGVADDICRAIGLDHSRIKVVYNPALRPAIAEMAQEAIEHPWFSDGAPPVVLGVGRLTQQKDFPTLIRAFTKVRAGQSAHLVILGEGEDRVRLARLAETLGVAKDVALMGFERNPYKYMRRSAVFVFSSLWEGFGNALVEAMALGTPVISTDCPSGPAEILDQGRWGKLVPMKSPDALAEAILQTLANPGPDGRERAKDFSVDRIVEQYLALLIPKQC
jgi:glycosyltransferase involved in cell wall biosynthesis